MERVPFDRIPRVLRGRVGYLISKVHMAMHQDANRAVELSGDFTVKNHASLRVIDDEGPISQQALSARIGVDRSTMVTLVDELEAGGFVTRTRNPADRRAYALEITEAGRSWLERTGQDLLEAETAALEPLSADERAELERLLLKLMTGEDAPSSVG